MPVNDEDFSHDLVKCWNFNAERKQMFRATYVKI